MTRRPAREQLHRLTVKTLDQVFIMRAKKRQGCYNATRSQMATVLTNWLATDPTGSDDPDFLIIGDLNAYALEDPITLIEGAAYIDLVAHYIGADAYSYVYYGQAGYLDHALANSSLVAQVTGMTIWHINADEPSVLDYNEEYKSPGQVESLYSDDPYRSSDHDPVIVGLELREGLAVSWISAAGVSRMTAAQSSPPRPRLALRRAKADR